MADVLSVIQDVLNQDKQQKREHARMMREVQKKLKEKDVSEEEGDKDEYMKFFADTLKKFGAKSPAELSPEDKKKFFDAIDKGWKGDNEKPEPEDEETNLGDRVKARMEDEKDVGMKGYEGEDSEEDEDDDEDTGVVSGGEPTDAELEKLADLVVQKIKDKADEEEDEEEEPESTEAEGGKEEKIDINPKMEQVRNPHARDTWMKALRQVYEQTQLKEVDTSWIDSDARKVERRWKSMNKNARKKWLKKMSDKAEDEGMKQAVLDDVLDDYGLTEAAYLDVRGYGDEGTTTSDPDKDYGLHPFSDPKYKPAYTDQSFETTPDKTGIGQDLGDKQSGTPNKAVGKATAAKKPADINPESGTEKPSVGTKSDTPDTAVGKATDAKIAPRVTTKDGVATQKEEVELDEKMDGRKKFSGKQAKKDNEDRRAAQRKRLGILGPNEETINEADYELYHKTFSAAMQHAYAHAKKKGYTVDPDEIDNKVATGPKKPSKGKTNRYILGTNKKQNLHVQVANLDNKRYELNMYIEEVDRAKDDSIEGPGKGKKHKCPMHVRKEGYGYGKNISHTLSENVVDKMNIYWYDSKEVSYMVPTSEVEIVSEGYHSMKNHREKFKSTNKIAEELRKQPNPFENIEEAQGMGVHDPIDSEEKLEVGSHPNWPEQPKKKKKKVTEKRSVAFARKFYQKETTDVK